MKTALFIAIAIIITTTTTAVAAATATAATDATEAIRLEKNCHFPHLFPWHRIIIIFIIIIIIAAAYVIKIFGYYLVC